MVRSRIKSIAFKYVCKHHVTRYLLTMTREKIDVPANVVDQLVQGTQSDIRQVLNILSTWKLGHDSMSFDEGKDL